MSQRKSAVRLQDALCLSEAQRAQLTRRRVECLAQLAAIIEERNAIHAQLTVRQPLLEDISEATGAVWGWQCSIEVPAALMPACAQAAMPAAVGARHTAAQYLKVPPCPVHALQIDAAAPLHLWPLCAGLCCRRTRALSS